MNAWRGLLVFGLAVATILIATAGPDTESYGPGQSIADELRQSTGSDAAFIAAGLMRSGRDGDLSSFVQIPSDQIAVVKLSGRQIKLALERSASLLPSPNPAFLQISGIEATVSRSASPESRVSNITVAGSPIDMGRTYSVAMPANLARGALGYFTVWEKSAIERTVDGMTLESLLRGKAATNRTGRWKFVD